MNVRNIPRLVTDAFAAQFNKLRADIAKGALGTVLHTGTVPSTIAALDTNDLPAATNILVTAYEAHRVSVFSGTEIAVLPFSLKRLLYLFTINMVIVNVAL